MLKQTIKIRKINVKCFLLNLKSTQIEILKLRINWAIKINNFHFHIKQKKTTTIKIFT